MPAAYTFVRRHDPPVDPRTSVFPSPSKSIVHRRTSTSMSVEAHMLNSMAKGAWPEKTLPGPGLGFVR